MSCGHDTHPRDSGPQSGFSFILPTRSLITIVHLNRDPTFTHGLNHKLTRVGSNLISCIYKYKNLILMFCLTGHFSFSTKEAPTNLDRIPFPYIISITGSLSSSLGFINSASQISGNSIHFFFFFINHMGIWFSLWFLVGFGFKAGNFGFWFEFLSGLFGFTGLVIRTCFWNHWVFLLVKVCLLMGSCCFFS